MRDLYPLQAFFIAAEAWERHKAAYMRRLASARQTEPSAEQLLNYKQVWIEGYLEAQADNAEETSAAGGS